MKWSGEWELWSSLSRKWNKTVWSNLSFKHVPLSFSNSSSSNKGKNDRDSVWISDLKWQRFLRFYFSILSKFIASIQNMYKTLKTVFDHISKHLEIRQKCSATCRIFHPPLGVWKCGQTSRSRIVVLLKFRTKNSQTMISKSSGKGFFLRQRFISSKDNIPCTFPSLKYE